MLSLIESLDRQDVEVFETNNPPPQLPFPSATEIARDSLALNLKLRILVGRNWRFPTQISKIIHNPVFTHLFAHPNIITLFSKPPSLCET